MREAFSLSYCVKTSSICTGIDEAFLPSKFVCMEIGLKEKTGEKISLIKIMNSSEKLLSLLRKIILVHTNYCGLYH